MAVTGGQLVRDPCERWLGPPVARARGVNSVRRASGRYAPAPVQRRARADAPRGRKHGRAPDGEGGKSKASASVEPRTRRGHSPGSPRARRAGLLVTNGFGAQASTKRPVGCSGRSSSADYELADVPIEEAHRAVLDGGAVVEASSNRSTKRLESVTPRSASEHRSPVVSRQYSREWSLSWRTPPLRCGCEGCPGPGCAVIGRAGRGGGRVVARAVVVVLVAALLVAAAVGYIGARVVWRAGCWVIVGRSGEQVEDLYGLSLQESRRVAKQANQCLELRVVGERACANLPPGRVVQPNSGRIFTTDPTIDVVLSKPSAIRSARCESWA